ncbi:hypothetical protein LPA49_07940 [Pseudoalteromonas sp. MB41]|uniref:hypothetical protein n=1 Tax=Pseudoalteromonas sp. MB41 TaxID=2896366 RepID=UPI001E5A32B7|nr:hypothetical protein [Pseudoalteromonas sp. MB41]MCC9660498.1 hypothetical protein [Pseudoalteromonas sp. MB41]
MIEGFGFTDVDKLLTFWCPIAAAFGEWLRFLSKARNYEHFISFDESGKAKEPTWASFGQLMSAVEWLLGHLILSAGAGLILSLYFVGMIDSEANAIARLLGVSIILGYIAPQLWLSQEKTILNKVEKIIASELNKIKK